MTRVDQEIRAMEEHGSIDWTLPPLDTEGIAVQLERTGVRMIFEDAPRAPSEETYKAIDRKGQQLIVTARALRTGL